LDNRACNLEYVTHQENQRRAMDMGKLHPPQDNERDSVTGQFKRSTSLPQPCVV
jgi:hypothetical protein